MYFLVVVNGNNEHRFIYMYGTAAATVRVLVLNAQWSFNIFYIPERIQYHSIKVIAELRILFRPLN